MQTYRTTSSGLLAGCLPLIMLAGIPSVSVGQFDELPIYGGGMNSQLIYTIDRNSGVADPLHAYIGRVQGLAYDTQNGDFYVGLDNSILLRVDNEHGDVTMFGTSGRIYHGLTYDPTRNVLWASDQYAAELFTVNPATAQATLIGSFGESLVGGLAFDPVSDTLYGVDDISNSTGSRLVEINKTDASLTQIGPLGLGQNYVDLDGLAYDVETGLLYSVQDSTVGDNTGQMFLSINPQTGLATPIGTTGLVYENGQGLAIPLPGAVSSADFDRDGDVDGDDFLSWQDGFGGFPNGGATLADGDADSDGDVDGDDFLVWQQQFGAAQGSGPAAVPEPASWLFMLIGAASCCFLRKRSGHPHSERTRMNTHHTTVLWLLTGCLPLILLVNSVQAVTMETVPIGNPNNPPDDQVRVDGTSGYGSVNYSYNMGKYEVTAGQYTEFLNAVADTDPYSLYSTDMVDPLNGCRIRRIGTSGSYEYRVDPEFVNRPVNYVVWADALRFANWMHNGQPTGPQNLQTTEDGAYYLNGATSASQLRGISREPDWRWALSNENEWYKAAYYDPSNSRYWDYPTQHDDPNVPDGIDFIGDTIFDAVFTDRYNPGHPYDVDNAGVLSAYGTMGQCGNVREWIDEWVNDNYFQRGLLGSDWNGFPSHAYYREGASMGHDPTIGFRIVSIPGASSRSDFDRDVDVDGDDFLSWQIGSGNFRTGGATLADGDADSDGDVDGDDFLIWQQEFGTLQGGGAVVAAVPEPSTLWLVAACILGGLQCWWRSKANDRSQHPCRKAKCRVEMESRGAELHGHTPSVHTRRADPLVRLLCRTSVALALLAAMQPNVVTAEWRITQLTDNDWDKYQVRISGTNVVWHSAGGIFLYDGTTTTQLADNSISIRALEISGGNVVWCGRDGAESSDDEIFLYDGTTTTRLTNNDYQDHAPLVFGDDVLWRGRNGTSGNAASQLFLYDGTTTTQLTNSAHEVQSFWKSGDDIVWDRKNGTDLDVFLYDGTITTQLSNNIYHDQWPQVSDGKVVWHGYDGHDDEIFLYDGTTTTQLTDNDYNDRYPQISGQTVAWSDGNNYWGLDVSNRGIYLYDGTSVTQQTNSRFVPFPWVGLSGENIVWYEGDGTDPNDAELFFYDGTTTTQLTDNSTSEGSADLSGTSVVWIGGVLNGGGFGSDSEIFLATIIPEFLADFDGNQYVNGDDFLIWQANFGLADPFGRPAHEFGDADLDGDVDGDDFLLWQQEFGTGAGSGSVAAAVPEPATWLLMLIGVVFWCVFGRRRPMVASLLIGAGRSVPEPVHPVDAISQCQRLPTFLVSLSVIAVLSSDARAGLLIPGDASGGFGAPVSGPGIPEPGDLVPGPTLLTNQTVLVTATGNINLGWAGLVAGPNGTTVARSVIIGSFPEGFTPLEETIIDAGGSIPTTAGESTVEHLGALFSAFVPSSTVATPGFDASDDDATPVGISSSHLQFVGNQASFTAPFDGQLFFGINEGFVSNNSGSFNVEVTPDLPGPEADFDADGDVDGDDFLIWQSNFGIVDPFSRPAHEYGDADLDADIDGDDFLIWQQEFGTGSGSGWGAAVVPEPSTLWLAAVCIMGGLQYWRRYKANNRRWDQHRCWKAKRDDEYWASVVDSSGSTRPIYMRRPRLLGRFFYSASIALVLLAAMKPPAVEAAWSITQLTDNDYTDAAPQISGNHVVWYSEAGTFLYNIVQQTTTLIPDLGIDAENPRISGDNVVWQGRDGTESSDDEIFLYNIGNGITTRLTNNDYQDHAPLVFGDDVLWRGRSGTSGTTASQLFLYDGTTTTQLTNVVSGVWHFWKSGDDIVWDRSDGNDFEIFLYDGTTTTQLTNNSYDDNAPRVYDGNVVWRGYDGSDWEIFHYDIDQETTTQLSDNSYDDVNPQISNEYIMWTGGDDNVGPIFLCDGTTTTQIADNYCCESPQLSGGNVAWTSGYDGSTTYAIDVFAYDGTTMTQVTNDYAYDNHVQTSDGHIVWTSWIGNRGEIFLATLVPDLTADFDEDLDVDGDDFLIWQTYFGLEDPWGRPVHEYGDADLDGDIDGDDFLKWQAEFG